MNRVFKLRDLMTHTLDGEWGKGSEDEDLVEMRVIRGTDFEAVSQGDFTSSPIRFIAKKAASRKALQEGDVLIETAGGSKDKPTGRTVVIKQKILDEIGLPTTCASFARFMRFDQNLVLGEYIYFYLQNLYKNGELRAHQVQHTGVARFQFTDFATNHSIEIPSLNIQHQIAAILSAFDDKIELNRQMNRTLEQMARALFKSWFVDFDPVRAKMGGELPEGMDAETAALFPNGLVEMEGREVPRGWTWQTVDQLYKLHGGSTPSTSNSEYWEGGEHHWSSPKDMSGLDVPFLTQTDKKITDAGTRVISSGILPSGTLLLSSRAPVGYMAIADMPVSINQGYIALESTGPLGRYFTLNLLQSGLDEVKAMASGTTFPELSKKTFRQFEMLVPSSEVAAAFEGIVGELYGKLREGIYESAQLAQLRDALLPRLLSGELDVADWEAALEPTLGGQA